MWARPSVSVGSGIGPKAVARELLKPTGLGYGRAAQARRRLALAADIDVLPQNQKL